MSYRTRKLQEQASEDKAEAQRIQEVQSEMTRFYTNITHEFRSPLTVVKSIGESLLQKGDTWSQTQGNLLARNVNRSLQLIDQILTLRKLERLNISPNLEPGEVISYLQYLTEPFTQVADRERIRLVFDTTIAELYMTYDRELLRQLLENLLSNAIKFAPPGGNIEVGLRTEDGSLIINVTDNGRGIPEAYQSRIFDRFFQIDGSLERQAGGSGIGLALVKEITQLLEGEVKSRVGEGSSFIVHLPIITAVTKVDQRNSAFPRHPIPVVNLSEPDDPPISPDKKVPSILLVDDESDILQVVSSMLSEKYRVLTAHEGRQASEIVRRELPQIVISDVMMPELDGLELCRLIKEDPLTCHIPVILLTARVTQEEKIEGLKHGADAYLTKPFSKEELLVRLEQLQRLREQLRSRYANLPDFQPANDLLGQQHDDFIRRALEAVATHYQDSNFGPDQLARALHISRTGLYSKLAELTGLTVSAFINQVRLDEGRKLLLSTNLSVRDIAFRVGFNSPDYFGRVFRERFGMTPRAMRDLKL